MSKRTYILVLAWLPALTLLGVAQVGGQQPAPASQPADTATPTAKTPAFPFEGEVSGTNVYVRSGPAVSYYPTTKLNAGDRVLVLGEKFGWYEIVPPPRSFSYVDTSAVERAPGAKTGKIIKEQAYVTAGSELEQRKTSTQITLPKGTAVEIIGEADGFYRIVPPKGAKLYISRQYVEAVPERLQTGLREQYEGGGNVIGGRARVPSGAGPTAPGAAASTGSEGSAGTASGGVSAEQPLPLDRRLGPSNKPAIPVAERDKPAEPSGPLSGRYAALLTILESELQGALKDPMKEIDFASLKLRYSEIANQKQEPVAAQIAEIRIRQLDELDTFRKSREEIFAEENELDDFRARLNEERARIMRRRAEEMLQKFDFEGEIRQSKAFASEKHRYRLVDPVKGTTVAYVDVPPTLGVRMETMIGRLVGIRAQRQYFSPSARVPIVVASSVVDISLRTSPPADQPATPAAGNIQVGGNKSTEQPSAERTPRRPTERLAGDDPERTP